jgi:succinoglycan biosynthesis transport protein ExoP
MNLLNPTPGSALQPALRPLPGPPAVPPDLSSFLEVASGDEITVRRVMLVLRKRKWIVLGTLLLIVMGTALVSLRTQKIYTASGRVLIGHETPMTFNNKDTSPDYNYDDFDYTIALETQKNILQSDAIALQVIREQHLDPQVPADKPTSLPSAVADINPARLAAALGNFHGSLQVTAVPRTRILELRYNSSDAKQSAAVVNATMNAYIEQNYRSKLNSATETTDWLSKQLVDLQAKVQSSQEKLVAYQKAHNIVGIDDKQNIVTSKLDQLNKALTEAEADRIQKESIFRMVREGNLALLNAGTMGIAQSLMDKLRSRQVELQDELAKARVTYDVNHPKYRELQNQLDELNRQLQAENAKLVKRTEGEYKAAAQREALLRDAVERQKKEANDLSEAAIEFSLLRRDAESSRQLYDSLEQKLKEAGVTAGLKSGNIRIIDFAQVPQAPSQPQTRRNIMLSIGLGLLAGILLAFLAEAIDNRIHTPEQAQAITMLPVLGLIPAQAALPAAGRKRLQSLNPVNTQRLPAVVLSAPKSEPAEAYRALRTCIQLSSIDRQPRVLVVSSGLAREGKTTTAVNTALVLAQQGSRVLLVDADLRRASVHKTLGMRARHDGLSELLAGQADFQSVCQPYPEMLSLHVISGGMTPPNPAEMLGSERMREFIRRWRTEFDYVVIDTPPALAVTDAVVLSAAVDAVILVARANSTPRSALRRARELFAMVNAPVLGIVLNAVNLDAPEYSNTYYYGSHDTDYNNYTEGEAEAAAAGK